MLLFAVAMTGIGTLTSCSDDDDSVMSRLFRPIISKDNIITGTDSNKESYVEFKWDAYDGADKYQITLTPADGSAEPIVEVVDTTIYHKTGLQYDIDYNVGVKAIMSSDTSKDSKDYEFSFTSADFPTDLMNITTANIIDTQIRLRWDVTEDGFNTVKIFKVSDGEEEEVQNFEIDADTYADGETIIRNLDPKKNYIVRVYDNEAYKGKKRFSTVASEDYGDAVVCDLRGLDPEDAWKAFATPTADKGGSYAHLIDSLLQNYGDKDITIILEGGQRYRMQAWTLPSYEHTLKIVTGLSLNGSAEFGVEGNFNLSAGATFNSLVLDNVILSEGEASGKTKKDSNYGGVYLMNMNGAGSKLNNLELVNSTVKYKRGICRIQTSAVIENFVMDNCIVDSIGGYGIANADNAGAEIHKIKITNSTFSNCDKFIVGSKPTAAGAFESIVLDHLTLCYMQSGTNPFFDFKAVPVPTFTFKNSIIGPFGSQRNKDGWAPGAVKGVSGATAPTCEALFATSDLAWQQKADGTGPDSPLAIESTLATDAEGTFKNPQAGDFTVIAGGSDFKAGDPRWLK